MSKNPVHMTPSRGEHQFFGPRHLWFSCFFQVTLCLVGMIFLPSVLHAEVPPLTPPQQAWLVKDYRYVPGSAADDSDTGLALCGTRCNAMTTDYRNVIDPGGYRYIRVAENKELEVPIDNPFIGGHCVCVADEYVIRVNELTGPER